MRKRDIKPHMRIAVGRPPIRGGTPTAIRQATVLSIVNGKVKIRYADNGKIELISPRDVYATWTTEFDHNGANTPPEIVVRDEGSPTGIAEIALAEMFIDYADEGGYQRTRTENEALKIAEAPNAHRWEVPHVSDRRSTKSPLGSHGERYAVVDGGARVLAAMLLGRTKMRVEIHEGLCVEDEAKLMRELGKGRKQISALDDFIAAVRQGEPKATAITTVIEAAGWSIGSGGDVGRRIAAIRDLERAFKLGSESLKLALWMLEPWAEDGKPTGPVLHGMTRFVHDYGDTVALDQARKKFAKVPMSTVERRAAETAKLSGSSYSRGAFVARELVKIYNAGRKVGRIRVGNDDEQ